MSEHVYFTSMYTFFGLILLVVVIRYGALILRAWAGRHGEGDYRALAEQAAASQAENTASLAAITARLANVERILKDVE